MAKSLEVVLYCINFKTPDTMFHYPKLFTAYLFILILLLTQSCGNEYPSDLVIVPTPHKVNVSSKTLNLKDGYSISISLPGPGTKSSLTIEQLLQEDLTLLTDGSIQPNPKGVKISLSVSNEMAKGQHQIIINESINIIAGSIQALNNGLSTIYQLITPEGNLPYTEIIDQADFNYRSLMIDCARAWHDIDNLKSMVRLCQFYKINHLHLHMTDDQLFTFPSDSYPQLMTDQHYTKNELIMLNEYAFNRGVILVPEIDMPGHASPFLRKMPEVFGIDDVSKNPYTLSIGSEKVYEAIDVLIGEMAEIFTHSPYIHIGGDEAFFESFDTDPTIIKYMKVNNIPSVEELFRHFLSRVNDMVKSHEKQMMIWAGFKPDGDIEIPRDIVIILWNNMYYDPIRLQSDGFSFINASFKPLYVVNNRKWTPSYILDQWNPRRWESWAARIDTFTGVEIPNNERLMGATMCTWEQNAINELPRLRKRVAAMSQGLWNENTQLSISDLEVIDATFSRFIRPFTISAEGLKSTKNPEGNFYDHLEFSNELNISLNKFQPNVIVRYTDKDRMVTKADPIMPNLLTIVADTKLDIQAFDQSGTTIGHPIKTRYIYKPISAQRIGLETDLPPNSWEKLRFFDSLTVSLSSSIQDFPIKYSLDGTAITSASPTYNIPIKIKNGIKTLKAQHFDIENDKTVGSALSETYYEIVKVPSLTTGKKSWASNSHSRPNVTEYANDGRITLWEQWGDHLDGNNWVQIDLGKVESIQELLVVNFWDNYRYYQYTISGSQDGKTWIELVDWSKNTELSTAEGYKHNIASIDVRFLKIRLTYNSANPGLHLVEFGAW